MTRSRSSLIVGVAVCLVSSWVAGTPAFGRDVKLVLHPQKAPGEVGEFSLLPPESSMIDEDAVPLYEKAAKALPDKAGDAQIREWVDMPIDQLPLDQVEQALSKYTESLKYAAKAVRCRQCNWPEWKPGAEIPYLAEYRRLAFVIQLWARLEVAQDGYEGAVLALRTGLGMARQLGQAPTMLQVLVGTAIGGLTCRQVAEFVQGEDAPNLCAAIASLPRPFADVEKAIQSETKAASSQSFSKEHESVLKPAYDRTRVLAKRLDRDLAILQCVEAIRSYAATHGGLLPKTLAEITEVSVPTDPLHEGPFQYSVTGSTAVLESAPPAGGSDKEGIRYEISIRK